MEPARADEVDRGREVEAVVGAEHEEAPRASTLGLEEEHHDAERQEHERVHQVVPERERERDARKRRRGQRDLVAPTVLLERVAVDGAGRGGRHDPLDGVAVRGRDPIDRDDARLVEEAGANRRIVEDPDRGDEAVLPEKKPG